ncbi:hypothetical protein G7046_g208 [Stylonectria norvegica]|nr:hypothetical protein G7046_g208 [Stylonectria norvegica]
MPRSDVEFKTSDGVTLRGWLYRPASSPIDARLPCIVLVHGFSALKEMDLNTFADRFTTDLPVSCLVYDNRGFGASDVAPGQPEREILPDQQVSDISDAITYAQSLSTVDEDKIAVWGSSYSGGHVLRVGAIDRRVKAVLSQVPCVDGWTNFYRLVRTDFAVATDALFQQDRLDRAAGKAPARIPVVDEDPHKPSALPTPDSFTFFTNWSTKSGWKNDVTLKSIEAFRAYNPSSDIHKISPTPLLMTVAQDDVLTPTTLALDAYARAREPKQLQILPGGHFDGYSGFNFEKNVSCQLKFIKTYLL